MKLHELMEAKAQTVGEMRALTDKADAEKRDLTDAEDGRFKELRTKAEGLEKQIERTRALQDLERNAPAIHATRGDGRFEDRARQFSLTRAIQDAIGVRGVDVGFEREISAEVQRRTGRKFEGIPVPDQVFEVRAPITVATEAADLVPNVHRPDLYIDRLRAALVAERMGATVLDNLVGTVDIPKAKTGATAYWTAEDGSTTESTPDFEDVNLTPKTVGAITSFTRRTLINASPSIEGILRNELAQTIASAIDYQAVMGDGTGNTPKGIVNTTGVGSVSMSAGPTWEKILEHVANVQGASADMLGALGWACDPFAVKKMRSTLKVTGDAGAGFIMEAPNSLAGFAAAVSSALPGDGGDPATTGTASTLVYGVWSQLLVAYWSGVDLLLNPFETTAYAKGRVLIRALRDVDVALRHAAAFSVSTDLDAH